MARRNALPPPHRPGPLLGAHQSIAGGLHRALERGRSLGCQAVQIFTRSARQWALRPLAEEDVRAFAAARAATGIRALLAHDSYLPNPAAPVASLRARSVRERIVAFHLNDAKCTLGGRVDRHEHIGRGGLGVGAFRRLLRDRRFRGLPMCIETPKGADLADDRRNLAVLRSLA